MQGFSSPVLRVWSISEGMPRRQKLESDDHTDHTAFTTRKQRTMKAGARLAVSKSSQSPPRGGVLPTAKVNLPTSVNLT